MTGKTVVLVISPSPYITNKIQQALEDIGGYRIITCNSPANAFELARRDSISICILDIFHPEFPLLAVTNELFNIQPEINFILIVSDQRITLQTIPGKLPATLLTRSFSTDQLSAALGLPKIEQPPSGNPDLNTDHPLDTSGSGESTTHLTSQEPQPQTRVGDNNNLAQRFTDLSMDSPPLVMFLLRRKQLLIHRGNLQNDTIQELVVLVNSFSNTSPQNLQKEFIPGNLKPSSGDMIRLIQLNSIPGKYLLYVVSISKDTYLVQLYGQDKPFSLIRRQTILITHALMETQSRALLEYRPDQPGIQQQDQPQSMEGDIRPTHANDSASTTSFPADEQSILTEPESSKDIVFRDISETENQWIGEALQVRISDKEQATGDNINSSLTQTPFGHYITYSCLLIPRMPQHMLTSNLASYLFTWMGQLCLAYGWRLEHLSIHSSHIQMITGAPLTTSPAFLVRTLRQKTSQYIFNQFPPLSNENSSGDFWAPGFFISGGKHTIQPNQIDRYVSEIREHQGVYPATIN